MPIEPKRQYDLATLSPAMYTMVMPFLAALRKAGLRMKVWEAGRTKERQAWLYGAGRTGAQCLLVGISPSWSRPTARQVTWTMKSQHLIGKAVDMVFLTEKNQPSWSGDWDKVVKIGKECGLQSLAPRELCHFQII